LTDPKLDENLFNSPFERMCIESEGHQETLFSSR